MRSDTDDENTASRRCAAAPLGLVLSSGAARGAAHVGVLIALAEAGIEPQVVVGTSAGALIGGAYAAGLRPEQIADRLATAGWADFGRLRPNRSLAVIETTALRANLEWVFSGRAIEELPLRFGAVATDLYSRRPYLISTGDAARAVQASIAVPGVFPPVRSNGRFLVDGVLSSPLPVWAALQLGATRTIGVRLRPQREPGPLSQLQGRLLPPPDDVRPDLEILIDTSGMSGWSARDVPRLVELGAHATRAALAGARREVLTGRGVAGAPR